MNDDEEPFDTGSRRGSIPTQDERVAITPNKHRLVQVRRAGQRKLFDRRRKEVFLEWFAATCNVRLSAGKAGVCDKTVYKHLMKDDAFVEAFGRALQVGYLRLEARQMQEAHQLRFGQSGTLAEDGPSTACGGPPPHPAKPGREDYEVRVLADAAAEEHFDPQLALVLLREHARRLSGSPDKRKPQRTTAQSATNQEIAEALAKRLKGFALRHGSAPHPAQPRIESGVESPSPSRGEGE